MAYKRKTYDEWEIQGHYGGEAGWEVLTLEESYKDAREMLKCYDSNEPNIPHRIVKKRRKINV